MLWPSQREKAKRACRPDSVHRLPDVAAIPLGRALPPRLVATYPQARAGRAFPRRLPGIACLFGVAPGGGCRVSRPRRLPGAYSSLWPCSSRHRARSLAVTLPYGVRTFLTARVAPRQRGCPAHFAGWIMRHSRTCMGLTSREPSQGPAAYPATLPARFASCLSNSTKTRSTSASCSPTSSRGGTTRRKPTRSSPSYVLALDGLACGAELMGAEDQYRIPPAESRFRV